MIIGVYLLSLSYAVQHNETPLLRAYSWQHLAPKPQINHYQFYDLNVFSLLFFSLKIYVDSHKVIGTVFLINFTIWSVF